jgi:hypothetical protein
MTVKERLQQQIDSLNKQIQDMENNNDYSIKWVDDLRDLIQQRDDLENKLYNMD